MFHAVTIPRAGFLHTTVYTNTSFRGTEGDGGSTTRYEALRRGCERSKLSMKCKGSKGLREDDLKLSVSDRLQMIEDDLKLMEDDWMNRTASDVEQTNNVMERHSVVEGSASILDERARNRYERARMLTEQAKKLNSVLRLLREQSAPAMRFCFGGHRDNFLDSCVGIFIDGTEEERSRGAQYERPNHISRQYCDY